MATVRLKVTVTDQQFFTDAQNKRESIRVWNKPPVVPHYKELWDSQNQQAKVWVKVPKIPANGSIDIWIYYGNPNANDVDNGYAVFDFFDDFNDGVIDSKWDVSGLASATEQNGLLYTTANANTWTNNNSAAIAQVNLDAGFYAKAKFSYTHNTSDMAHIFLRIDGSPGYVFGGLNDAWAGEQPVYTLNVNGTGTNSGKMPETGTITVEITRRGTNVTVTVSGDTTITGSGTLSGTLTNLRLINQRYETYAGRTAEWDYVLIAKLADQDPTITIGDEQPSDVENWLYRRKITISNPNSYDLEDFQVAIDLDSSNFDFSKANSDGSDIRFALDDPTPYKMSYYIETWDTSTPQAVIWVAIDENDPDFYIEVNPSYVQDESDSSVLSLPEDTTHTVLKTWERLII